MMTGRDQRLHAGSLLTLHRPDPDLVIATRLVPLEAAMPCMAMDPVRYVGELIVALVAEVSRRRRRCRRARLS